MECSFLLEYSFLLFYPKVGGNLFDNWALFQSFFSFYYPVAVFAHIFNICFMRQSPYNHKGWDVILKDFLLSVKNSIARNHD